MKNYMKYFLLMGLVSVAMSAAVAHAEPEIRVFSENPDVSDGHLDEAIM